MTIAPAAAPAPVVPGSLLLALADSRLPTGGHVHSGGAEQAIAAGLVTDVPSLDWFVRRRLATAGLTAGAAAAAAARWAPDLERLSEVDRALDVRTASPALRAASRAQGRSLRRLVAVLAPGARVPGRRPHAAVVVGALAAALSIDASGAALLGVHLTATSVTGAAQRLLALDPLAVAALTAALAPTIDGIARQAAAADSIPDLSDPLADLLAENHHPREDRYFVS